MTRRMTRQRQAVLRALEAAGGYVSAQELHARLQADGAAVSLSTVYRILAVLADDGVADTLRGPDGANRYHACHMPARVHHHLICRVCGHALELEGGEADRAVGRLAAEAGFADSGLTWDVIGTCADCDAAREPRTPTSWSRSGSR